MEEDDEDMIGPAPFTGDQSDYSSSAAADFDRRAQAMKNKLDNPVSGHCTTPLTPTATPPHPILQATHH